MNGMFNYQNPQMLQQEYLQNMMVNPQQMSQLPLLNQVTAMGGNAGALVGTGIGRLFGGRTSDEVENEAMKEIFAGANAQTEDPVERMAIAAKAMRQRGLEGRAIQLEQEAAKLQQTRAATRKTEADMLGEQQGYQMRFEGLRSRHPEMADEEARAIAQDPAAFRELMKTPKVDTQVVETAQGQLLINKRTGETITNLGASPDRRAVNKINIEGTSENEYAKVAGRKTAERDIETIEGAQKVAGTLPKMYETKQLIETGDLNTGIGAEIQQVVSRSRAKFLNDKQQGKVVNDTEYLNALLGSDVFPQISALGIGARGLDTPAEREFLREVITGTISMDRETLKRMTDFRIRSAENAVKEYNTKLEKGEFGQYQQVTGRQLSPVRVTDPSRATGGDTNNWSIRSVN